MTRFIRLAASLATAVLTLAALLLLLNPSSTLTAAPNGLPPNQRQELMLLADEAQENDWFGDSVAIEGSTLVIGAPGESGGPGDPATFAGAAYVFQRSQGLWIQVAKLTAADGQEYDRFGRSVAISDDTIIVGAMMENGGPGDPLPSSGAAYVFRRNQGGPNNWGQVAKLTAADSQAYDRFGTTVAIDEDTIIVGAFFESGGPGDPLPAAGAAYVYNRNQGGPEAWGQVTKLTASDIQANDGFGLSVDISDDTIVVGSWRESGGPGNPIPGAGAVYVFARNQGGPEAWGEVTKITTTNPQQNDYLGYSVSIDGNTIVAGAIMYTDGSPGNPTGRPGAAYIFDRNQGGPNGWGQVAELTAEDGTEYDEFGGRVAIKGDTVVVGVPLEDGGPGDPFLNNGAVYLYYRNQNGPNNWGQVKKFMSSTPQHHDNFGQGVDVSDELVLIGAWLKNTGTNNTIPDSGAAYLYLNPTALNIAKVGPPLSNAGAAITYTISITNNLPLNLTGLVLTDIIPAGAVYLSGGTLNGSVVSWTIPSLTSGQTISRQFAVTAASTITNSDFQVTAVENYTATGLLPVVTHPVTDRSYLPLFRKK